jgi:hypothetical protein
MYWYPRLNTGPVAAAAADIFNRLRSLYRA